MHKIIIGAADGFWVVDWLLGLGKKYRNVEKRYLGFFFIQLSIAKCISQSELRFLIFPPFFNLPRGFWVQQKMLKNNIYTYLPRIFFYPKISPDENVELGTYVFYLTSKIFNKVSYTNRYVINKLSKVNKKYL